MAISKCRPQNHACPRKRAEGFLNKNPEYVDKKQTDDVRKLIEELQIHQLELELQNVELRKAQQEIETSRDRYSDLYDFAPVGYMTLSNNGLILEANLTIGTMLGVERSVLTGKPFTTFISRDDQDLYYFHHNKLLETNIKQTCELRLVKDDVIQFYAQLESILIEDAEGNIIQTRTAITDISERRQAKEMLLNAYEEIEQRVKDRTYELAEANKALKQQIKERRQSENALYKKKLEIGERVKELSCLYSISTIVGTPNISIDNILQGIVNLIPPACKYPEETCSRILVHAKEHKTENFKETNWKQTIDIVVHSGKVGYLQVCFLGEKPEIDEGPFLKEERSLFNAISQFLGRILDRKWYEEALRENHAKYQNLYDYAPDMYVSVDAKTTNILDCNQTLANALDYKKEEIIGRPVFDLYTSESADYAKANVFPEVVKSGTIQERELQLQRKDKSVIDVSLNGSAVRDKKGDILYIKLSWRDITEKKKLQAQLQQAHKMEALGILAGGIAHDFNNILTSIMGYTQISLDALTKRTIIYENLQHILKAGYRAKNLIKQVVTFARTDKKGRHPVQVAPLVKEALMFLKSSLPSMIKINRYIKVDFDIIAADSTQIHQLLMNLCTNAAHAMGENGGVLKVTLTNEVLDSAFIARHPDTRPGLYLKLSVSDTGHGIPPDIREKIFDPYFTSKDKDHGTGLGLSVVHGIVKKYGGTIMVETEVGKGSTFSVYLPVTESEVLGKPDKNTEPADFAGNDHILLIDDDNSVMKVGKKMLEQLGYQVVSKTGAMEALALFRSQPDKFDLVLTDMAMPHLTGAKLAKKILEIRPDIPIILCTGNSEFINEKKAGDIGIKAFIMKPFIYHELAQTVRNVIDGNSGIAAFKNI